jgi:DNA polymerase II small subunit/DNA polymerase delta subunit B
MKQHESAILTLTDLHFGKKTATFNPDKFAARLANVSKRITRIHSLLSDYKLDELVICLLGDVNDGTGIYPTQFHHQAISNVEEQADILSELLAKFARGQCSVWKKIRVECVAGNHGRGGREAHEAANWDIVAYRYLAKDLADDEIKVNIGSEGNPFLRKIQVRKHKYLLYHGHEIRTFSNIPWYGMMLRLLRWNTTKRLAPFDVVLMGHFHSWGVWQINRVKLFCNGTFVSDDEWALQTFGWESANKTWLFGVSDHRPVTWQFGLELE